MRAPNSLRPAREQWRLSDAARATVASIARVVCPQHTDDLVVTTIEKDHALVDEVEASVGALNPLVRTALATALAAYDAGALVRYGALAHRLTLAQSRAYYQAWLQIPGPTHELALRVKQLICMAYYELPVVRAALDYRPEDWIARVTAERLARHADAIVAHEESLRAPDPLSPLSAREGIVPAARLVRAARVGDDTGGKR